MTSRELSFAAAVAALSLNACSAGDETAFVVDDVGQPAGVEKVFEDRYSEAGTLSVYEDAAGLTLLVTGGMGVDDPEVLVGDVTLSDLYRTLHPELDAIPADLEELSARLEEQHAGAPLDESNASRAPEGDLDKSQAFFNSTVCVVHPDRPDLNVLACKYGFVTSPNTLDYNYNFSDRSFTYNDNSSGQTRTRLYFNGTPTAQASLFLPAGNWGFGSWPNAGAGYTVRAGFHDRPNGNIGLTLHQPFRPR